MTTTFNVLVPGNFLDEQNKKIILQSFARLFHNITPKHKRRIRLHLIEDETSDKVKLQQLLKLYKLEKVTEIISRSEVTLVESIYQKASVFIYPSNQNVHRIIPEALSYGLPVLTVDSDQMKGYIDSTCGMIIRRRNDDQMIQAFSNMLSMLYFDPEVLKVLKKGAKRKHRNHFSWGVYERRSEANS